MFETPITQKKSSFDLLRQAKQSFSKEQQRRNKKMKKKKFLKEQIYRNRNIFQSLSNNDHFNKTMTAQNIIWSKNYELKESINSLKEQNSSLKARIWNVQKENRKMDRQINAWGISKIASSSSTKPYIDTATAEKVLHDQDYSITSTKIEIMELEKLLADREEELEQKISNSKNVRNLKNSLNHEIQRCKVMLYEETFKNTMKNSQQSANGKLSEILNARRQELIAKNQELDMVKKNIELKKKSQNSLEEEVSKISEQLEAIRDISQSKIVSMKEEAYKLKTEDESYVNEEVKKLSNAKDKVLEKECKIQNRMGEWIKSKIEIDKEIKRVQKKIDKLGDVLKMPSD